MGAYFQPRRSRQAEQSRRTPKYRFGILGAYLVGVGALCAQLAFVLPSAVGADLASHSSDVVAPASVSSRGAASIERDTPIPEVALSVKAESTPTDPIAPEQLAVSTADGRDFATPESAEAVTELAVTETATRLTTEPSDTAYMAAARSALVAGVTAVSTPIGAPARRAETVAYTVEDGDTIVALAKLFDVTERTIAQVNGLQPNAELLVGQKLLILPVSGTLHTVVVGETVLSLAERYRVIPEDIAALNSLVDPDVIVPGQRLVIPEVPDFERQPLATATATLSAAAPTATPTSTTRPAASAPTLTPAAVPPTATAAATSAPTQTPTATRSAEAPGGTYVVAAGDTAYSIARRFGVPLASLVSANNLGANTAVRIGQKLTIPGVADASSSPVASAPAAPTATPAPPAIPATATPTAVPATSTPRPQATATPPVAVSSAPTNGAKGAAIVATAFKFIGYRYVWGGTTPQPGFDCSGFVYYVLRQVGVGIPRDLGSQLNYGTKVDRSALQPGDVVFFQNTYRPGLSHDGIFIGNGQFIHAATENVGVVVSNLDGAYWKARYVGAIRP